MPLHVRDVMTSHPDSVSPDTSLATAAQMIIEKRYSGLPVCDPEGRPVGVVEVDDLLPRPGNVPATNVPVLQFQGEWVEEENVERFLQALRQNEVEGIMRTEFARIGRENRVGEALSALVTEHHRRLLVVDPDTEELIGVITRTDLLRMLTGGV